MKTIFGSLIIAFGVFAQVLWLGVCFGTVIVGILLLIFAPSILFFPFTFFLLLGLSVMNVEKFGKTYSFKYSNYRYGQNNQEFYTQNINNVNDYYKTLESSKEDSLETIKQRYRTLMKKYHYDSILSKNLSQEDILFAEEKTRKLNEAYAAIKNEKLK